MTLIADTSAAAPVLRLRPIPVTEPRPGALPVPHPPAAPPARVRTGRSVLADLPEPQAWALQFTRVALEVATGLRPPVQLVRWTSPAVLAALTRRHALAQRGGGRPPRATVRSVRVCEPVAGVAEVAAVVSDGARVRALAVRMEGEGGRWRVVAFDLG